MPDYYAVLDLAPDASQEAIKAQFHLLMQVWHPDKVPDHLKAAAAAKAREIIEAHKVLGDPKRRRAYDAQHRDTRAQTERQRRAWEENKETQRAYEERQRHQDTPADFVPRFVFLHYTRQQVLVAGLGLLLLMGCVLFFTWDNQLPLTTPLQGAGGVARDSKPSGIVGKTKETALSQGRYVAQDQGVMDSVGTVVKFFWSAIVGILKILWFLLHIVIVFFLLVLGIFGVVGNDACGWQVDCMKPKPLRPPTISAPQVPMSLTVSQALKNALTDTNVASALSKRDSIEYDFTEEVDMGLTSFQFTPVEADTAQFFAHKEFFEAACRHVGHQQWSKAYLIIAKLHDNNEVKLFYPQNGHYYMSLISDLHLLSVPEQNTDEFFRGTTNYAAKHKSKVFYTHGSSNKPPLSHADQTCHPRAIVLQKSSIARP